MRQRVTAVLVARNGAGYLERTLAAVASQTRQPDAVIAVDAGSTDRTSELLAASGPAQLVSAPAKTSFGAGIGHGMHGVPLGESDNEWLWFLAHDSAPQPRALQQLLAAVEIAPSVAIAGPKLMRWEQPDVIAEFGEAMTQFGASMPLVVGELDQAQHDVSDDVLGVAAQGMLVRRSLWSALGGFDPGLPSVDAGLDFSIRARLAGFRVILVPGAKVSTAGGPEHFGRETVSAARQVRVARSAQLHRRLVYAPPVALLLHWMSLVPLAVLRSLGHLLAKRPDAIPGEFAAALGVAFGDRGITAARRNLRRTRRLGWGAITPLRLPWADVRERRAQGQEAHLTDHGQASVKRVGFVAGGGLIVAALAALAGLIAFGPLLGAPAVTGGGLLPLDASVAGLWGRLGYGWREIGTGFVGAADPFAAVLALLGSLTFWAPSVSVVALHFAALPLAATGAWFAARRLSTLPWVPAVAAALWAVAPPLLSALTTGHLGATIAHLLLPWLALALIAGSRSWPAAAGAALLMAGVAASAPVLTPALLAVWIVWMAAHPRGIPRLIAVPLPTVALFAPLVVAQLRRGNPLAILADPGVPARGGTASGWQLALGSADGGLNGWTHLLELLGLPTSTAPFVVAGLLAVLAVLALLALFVPGSRRAFPSLIIALLGFATAVAASRIEVSSIGADTVSIWPGSGLSLFWLGLVGCVVAALEALGRAAKASASLAVTAAVILAAPLLAAGFTGLADIGPSSGRIVSAVVAAESRSNPSIGTLVLTPEDAGADPAAHDTISTVLERGLGATLDDQSTLAATAGELSETDARLLLLAGNLSSRSGFDPTTDLGELFIGFVTLADVDGGTETTDAVRTRVSEALDGNDRLTPVGQNADGLLWRVTEPQVDALADRPGNTGSALGVAVLFGQGTIFLLTLLLAIPTARRHRRAPATALERPATTFDEDDNG